MARSQRARTHERAQEPREQDRRPRRGRVRPRLPSERAPGRDRAQARARDGRAQDGLRVARLRAERVPRLRSPGGPRALRRLRGARWSRSSSGYLLEHARREKLALLSRPDITFHTDERLPLGEFGIQARMVHPPDAPEAEPAQGDVGHTMIYSAERLRAGRGRPPPRVRQTAIVVAEGRRMVVGATGAVIGRSRDCDIVLDDHNVSRRHAEVRPTDDGWAVNDLGSTNGVLVNGRRINGTRPLRGGRPDRAGHVRAALRAGVGARIRYDPGARLRRAQVRLPRRALPVPAVGRAQRPEGPRAGAPRPPSCRPTPTGMHSAVSGRRPIRCEESEPRLRVEQAMGHARRRRVRPARRRGARPRGRGGDPARGPVRLLPPLRGSCARETCW